MNIGKNITAFRKDAGMTQEDLANQIGVSAQAVSKWETGVSMPDILLLPVIAEVFGITVDEIYSGKQEIKKVRRLGFGEAPEAAYRALLETMERTWDEKGMSVEQMMEDYQLNNAATFIASDDGGSIFTNAEMGIVLRDFGTRKFLEVLTSEKAAAVLEVLADEKVRRAAAFLCSSRSELFTEAGLAKKLSVTLEEAKEILEKMAAANIIFVQKATVADGEELKVYVNSFCYNDTKIMAICLLLKLAENIQMNNYYFRGYRGVMVPVDPEILD